MVFVEVTPSPAIIEALKVFLAMVAVPLVVSGLAKLAR
jgi:hypothetical protein